MALELGSEWKETHARIWWKNVPDRGDCKCNELSRKTPGVSVEHKENTYDWGYRVCG